MSGNFWQVLEDALFRWLARRRLHRGLGTKAIPRTIASSVAGNPVGECLPVTESKVLAMPRRIDDVIAASLQAVPCAACDSDAAWISAERIRNDSAHCEVCDLNWPTRIVIGNEALQNPQQRINHA